MENQRLRQSLDAGLTYLAAQQQNGGNFRVWTSQAPDLQVRPVLEQSVFATACIVFCLEWLHGGLVETVRGEALEFLRAERNERELWRYYASAHRKPLIGNDMPTPVTIVPDLDTTSCVSVLLKRYGPPPCNADTLLANRTEEGLFQTWLTQEPLPMDPEGFPVICVVPTRNDVCPAVNANVLLYLGECDATRAAVDYVRETFCRGIGRESSKYYPDEIVLCYFYSRAYFAGVSSLASARPELVASLLSQQCPDGSFGTPLQTALTICTLFNFGVPWTEQEAAARFLLNSQGDDGSWGRSSFYIGNMEGFAHELYVAGARRVWNAPLPILYYGSEEITTAYCLEALSRLAEAR